MTAFADLQRQLAELAPVKGIAPVDILQLPAAITPAVRKMMRHGLTLAELARELDLSLDQARQVGDLLVDKGFLTSQQQGDSGATIYKVYFARMRGQNIAVDL
jgi:hypothetical protein